MPPLSRRRFVRLAAGAGAVGLAGAIAGVRPAMAGDAIQLRVERHVIEVDGKAATVLGVRQPDGTPGLTIAADRRFRVELENRLAEDTLIHWHGLLPPYQQDGVPGISQPALPPGQRYAYDFALGHPGTYWMHSHQGLQEQRLLAAPLIITDPAEAGLDEQPVVVLLGDFSFKDPAEILAGLRQRPAATGGAGGSGSMAGMKMGGAGSMAGMTMDLNDVDYDAYLANQRTLADPEIVRVESGGRVRLRLINGGSGTNFVIDCGALPASLVAVDGQPVVPVAGSRFDLALAQRIDLRLTLPPGGGAFPVLALREGDRARTGIVLATPGAAVTRLAAKAEAPAGRLTLDLEQRLRPRDPPAGRPADRRLPLDLTGDMAAYRWGLNGKEYPDGSPLAVAKGERVEVEMRNRTGMSHPMHLHGHVFQVVAIDGKRLDGALRDTVLVPPERAVTIAFDADNPGRWAFHCHVLYHMEVGMFTTVAYDRY
jgi:FtsP/CotA-like multicopper oxidase with cupredoxin domain